MNSVAISPFTSLCLKICGVVFILSSLIDFITLAIPAQLTNTQWQIGYTTAIVDRGIVPLVGMMFLIVGYWIDSIIPEANVTPKAAKPGKKPFKLELRIPVFLLATFLGLVFLLLVPLHINNLRKVSNREIASIEKTASEQETRIQEGFDQINSLSQDPEKIKQLEQTIAQINQVITTGQIQGQELNDQQKQELTQKKVQLEDYQQMVTDPDVLEAQLNQRQTQVREAKIKQQNSTKLEAVKQGFRIGLGSLLLAIAYSVIGWFGLRGIFRFQPKKSPSLTK